MQDTNERHGSGVAVWFFRTLLLLAAAVVMTVALVPGAQAAESQNSAPRSVIPLGRAAAQAQEYGHSLEREVSYLAVHSVLHLLGYDHLDEGPMKRQMREREEAILNGLGIRREE